MRNPAYLLIPLTVELVQCFLLRFFFSAEWKGTRIRFSSQLNTNVCMWNQNCCRMRPEQCLLYWKFSPAWWQNKVNTVYGYCHVLSPILTFWAPSPNLCFFNLNVCKPYIIFIYSFKTVLFLSGLLNNQISPNNIEYSYSSHGSYSMAQYTPQLTIYTWMHRGRVLQSQYL